MPRVLGETKDTVTVPPAATPPRPLRAALDFLVTALDWRRDWPAAAIPGNFCYPPTNRMARFKADRLACRHQQVPLAGRAM